MVIGLDRTKKPRVFISFAKVYPVETRALKEWLSQHLSVRFIYSADEPDDWREFCGETNSHPGVVLFHELYPCYSDMPHLYKYLRPASSLCFNFSFRHREGRQIRDDAFNRIFPRGTALCLTEDTVTKYPEETLSALEWFENGSIKKEHHWRIMLPPDPASLILMQAEADGGVAEKQ